MTVWTKIPFEEIPNHQRLLDYVRQYADETPDREAAVDLGGARLTYRSLFQEIEAYKTHFSAAGVKKGDIVALMAGPSTEFWAFFLAVIDIGAVFFGLNPRYTPDEVAGLVNRGRPVLVFAPSDHAYTEGGRAVASYEPGRLKEAVAQASVLRDNAPIRDDWREDPPSLLVFTSGSTGQPKGALLREKGLIACARVQAHHYGVKDGQVFNPLPINHVGCVCDTAATVLVTGGAQVFTPFDPAAMLRALGPEKINSLGGVPTMFQLMLGDPAVGEADFSHLKRLLWSGSPMPKSLGAVLTGLGLPVHNFFGMTETTGSITFTDPDVSMEEAIETIGKPESSYRVRIADAQSGRTCAVAEVGEIQVRSPGVLHSYLDDPVATKEAFTDDGWFKTGDLAFAREDGAYVLTGRLREMFKSGGYNVYPREVESALEQCDGIAMAAVVAVPDQTFGEVGYAYLVPVRPGAVHLVDVQNAMKERLANYKAPKHYAFLDTPPVLPTGKIDKKALAEMARDALVLRSEGT